MFKINSQRGLSPLIATILLVAVSLSLAGILYSWASGNAGDTVNNVTETSRNWEYCSNVVLNLDNCRYDTATGLSLILFDNSTVDLDGNLTIQLIDAEDEIGTATIEPNFQGRAMSIKSANYSEDLAGYSAPLKLVKVYLNICSERAALTRSCS